MTELLTVLPSPSWTFAIKLSSMPGAPANRRTPWRARLFIPGLRAAEVWALPPCALFMPG